METHIALLINFVKTANNSDALAKVVNCIIIFKFSIPGTLYFP
jgi:hypothetical protein